MSRTSLTTCRRYSPPARIWAQYSRYFCDPSGPKVWLPISAIGEQVHFIVADNGPGIAAKDVARLGRPFERGDVVMANGMKGSGLGLAIANSLVELHRGTLRLQSRAGEGAAAMVTLPRVQRGLRALSMARVA